jgi:hypothetical protein
MSAASSASATGLLPVTLYKMDIQGIVYLVDPATTIAYTYDLESPTPIGKLKWSSPSAAPRIQLFDDWAARLAAKKVTWGGYPTTGETATTTATDASATATA